MMRDNRSMTEQEKALRELQELAFALQEATLFLDGHPRNTGALRYHQKNARTYGERLRSYEAKWGPITSMNSDENATKQGDWSWVMTPWPWEIAYPAASDAPHVNQTVMRNTEEE